MKTGVENGMFRSEIGSGFEDPDGTPPPRYPRSTPPPPLREPKTCDFVPVSCCFECSFLAATAQINLPM